jgi:hypothetical protein
MIKYLVFFLKVKRLWNLATKKHYILLSSNETMQKEMRVCVHVVQFLISIGTFGPSSNFFYFYGTSNSISITYNWTKKKWYIKCTSLFN